MFSPENQSSKNQKTNPDEQTEQKDSPELIERFENKLEKEKSLNFIDQLFQELPELKMYLVGGMVRDTIIKYPTSKDYDFIAQGVPLEKLIPTLKKMGKVEYTGRNFGVLKFIPKGSTLKEAIDIALPRTEQAIGTGAYRDVTTQSDPHLKIEDDLARRDLTINAVAWELKNNQLIDPFDGQKDLKDKVIRAVGDPEQRFQEDYSRLLRALRFSARFGFEIEPKTWQALQSKMAHINDRQSVLQTDILKRKIELASDPEKKAKLKKQLKDQKTKTPNKTVKEYTVPRETVAKEMLKTFKENPAWAMELYDQSGAFEQLLPEVITMKGCEQPEQFHAEGDVWNHTKLMLQKIRSEEFRKYFPGVHISGEFALGVLLHDIGKPVTQKTPEKHGTERIRFDGHDQAGAKICEQITDRLNLSNEQKEKIQFMVQNHMFLMSAEDISKIKANKIAKRFIDSPHSRELLMLFYLDSACSLRPDGSVPMDNFKQTLKRIEKIKKIRENQPKKIISGNQIMQTLEIKGGPFIGSVITALNELSDEGQINSTEQALSFLEKHKTKLQKLAKQTTGKNSPEIGQEILSL